MSAPLFFPVPWRRQPQQPLRPSASNALCRRLIHLIDFTSGVPCDLVTGAYLTQVSTAISRAVVSKGVGLQNTDESSYWTLPITTELVNSFSMGWVGLNAGGSVPAQVRDFSVTGGTILFWRNSGWDQRLGGTDYSAAGVFNTNTVYAAAVTSSASAAKTFVDGVLILNGGAPGATALISPWTIHHNGNNAAAGPLSTTLLLPVWDRPLSDSEALSFTRNPWQLFEDNLLPLPFDEASAASNATGTIASTLADTTGALAGGVTDPGTFASTLADTVGALAGAVGNAITGTISALLANVAAAFSGAIPVTGTIAVTLGDTVAGFGGMVGTLNAGRPPTMGMGMSMGM